MNAVDASRTLTDWLEELVSSAAVDQRMVAIEGNRAGLHGRRVVCTLHGLQLDWLAAYRHLTDTEVAHRRSLGPAARLHRSGDLIPATPLDDRVPVAWPTSKCRECRARVIWASTSGGGRLPVDSVPDPSGDVVLAAPSSGSDQPLAVFLYSESGREHVSSATDIYARHVCSKRPARRRRGGSS